jgi:hypothetical protein
VIPNELAIDNEKFFVDETKKRIKQILEKEDQKNLLKEKFRLAIGTKNHGWEIIDCLEADV